MEKTAARRRRDTGFGVTVMPLARHTMALRVRVADQVAGTTTMCTGMQQKAVRALKEEGIVREAERAPQSSSSDSNTTCWVPGGGRYVGGKRVALDWWMTSSKRLMRREGALPGAKRTWCSFCPPE